MFKKLNYLFLTFAFFVNNQYIFGQISILKDFSKKLYAEVNLIDSEKNESIITVYNTSDSKKILTVKSDSYTMDTQIKELYANSYQEIILFQDFNFDNFEDLAIQTGYSSKGPAYSIFLFKDGNYILSKEFTEIIQNSQGDFDLEKSTKTINTRGNGGCCWHSYSKYTVINGSPKLMSKTVEELDYSIETVTTTVWNNGKYIKNTIKTIDLDKEGIKEIMSFNLTNSKKRLVLYNINDRTLNYALIHSDNTIEFYFPYEVAYKSPDFGIRTSPVLSELTFFNNGVKYRIYQKKTNHKIIEVGIIVTSKGKVFNLKGELSSLKGDLRWSDIVVLDNVFSER